MSVCKTSDHQSQPTAAMPLRVVFAGTPAFAAQSLRVLIEQQQTLHCHVVGVYCQPDRRAGRGQKTHACAVKQVAQQAGIALYQPTTFKNNAQGQAARQQLADLNPDVLVVAAYGLILPKGVLAIPKHGCINIHASLLPRWRGAAPIHRAVLAGDQHSGITIMQMDAGLDTGDMLYQTSCPIAADDSAASLHDRLAVLGSDAICQVLTDLPYYQQHSKPQPQVGVTYASKLSKAEGQINWRATAEDIERQIRGLTPWPGTFAFLANPQKDSPVRVKILTAQRLEGDKSKAQQVVSDVNQRLPVCGEIVDVDDEGITVACAAQSNQMLSHDDAASAPNATQRLRIIQLQFAGGKPMQGKALMNAQKIVVGDRLVLPSLPIGDDSQASL